MQPDKHGSERPFSTPKSTVRFIREIMNGHNSRQLNAYLDILAESWIGLITTISILAAVVFLVAVPITSSLDKSDLSVAGDFIAGIAGALALLWLVAGYRMQGKELELQRQQLEAQARELHTMARLSALEHAKNLIEQANDGLRLRSRDITTEVLTFIAEFQLYAANELYASTSETNLNCAKDLESRKSQIDKYRNFVIEAARLYLEEKNVETQETFISQHRSDLCNQPYFGAAIESLADYEKFCAENNADLAALGIVNLIQLIKKLHADPKIIEDSLKQYSALSDKKIAMVDEVLHPFNGEG